MTLQKRNVYLENIPIEEARQALWIALAEIGKDIPLAGETVNLADSLGRVTAEPVWAKISAPHYHAGKSVV